MGGASKLLSSLLLTSSPLRLRPSAAAFALFLSPPAASSRRQLLLSSPTPLRTLSTSSSSAAAASSFPYGSSSSSVSPAQPHRALSTEWACLVDRLTAAGYAQRDHSPADELALAPGCGLSSEAEAAVSSCLAFARDRPDLLRSLPRKDVEVLVANTAPALFKDGDASARRLQQYLSEEGSNVFQSERAETIDVVRYLLSYTYSSSESYSENKELTDSAVRSILSELVSFSAFPKTSSFAESALGHKSLSQHDHISRPAGQNIEMKRGDWICTRCSFMNFARNAKCLECNEHRPKKMLTGGEWECPQCEFYNYGRNMSCLRCDCKRPGTIPPNPASARAGLGGVAQLLNGTNVGRSEIERKLAENDEKAERWLSKVSQLDDSADLSNLADDEDFPEIMPMRKGVNKFVVSTRKTPLERRLTDAQYISNNGTQAASSDSKISKTLDRILGRSASASVPTNQSGNGGVNAGASKESTGYLGGIDPIPFVPLSADQFAKPHDTHNNGPANKADSSKVDSTLASTESTVGNESLDTSEKWSMKAAELGKVKDLPSTISDEEFPDIMPMRKGENRFVISKKKDRSLTSPQYKRRSVLEQADDSNFVPFVPFPPGYFDKKDKPMESTPEEIMSESSPSVEKLPETNSSRNLRNMQSSSQAMMGSQTNNDMNNESGNINYPQQNLSTSGHAYGENSNYQHQPQSHGVGGRSSGTVNTGNWNTNYSDENFNQSKGGYTYNGGSNSAQPHYTSGYSSNSNAWRNDNNNNNNTWSSTSSYNNSGAWSGNSSYNNSSTLSSNSSYNNNNAPSNNNWSGSYSDNSSASSISASASPNQTAGYSTYGESSNRGYTGKSLEGSAVRDPDPLDMSEEAKAERWFRRAAQIKDISELANIPDEDFPEIMPMRKGVNRFVVSKRKTPTQRRLTSPQYRRNLPIVSSEPDNDAS